VRLDHLLSKENEASLHKKTFFVSFSFEGSILQNFKRISSEKVEEAIERSPERMSIREDESE
jgi:hypothetical protein